MNTKYQTVFIYKIKIHEIYNVLKLFLFKTDYTIQY